MSKKKSVKDSAIKLMRQSRDRTSLINPVTKIVPNKKKKNSKKACRGKVVI
jgi:hypothetical protein